MTQEEIADRTRTVLGKVLELDLTQNSSNVSSLSLSNWDSLHHMNVILALENEFNIEFDDMEIQKLNSLELLTASISRHLQS